MLILSQSPQRKPQNKATFTRHGAGQNHRGGPCRLNIYFRRVWGTFVAEMMLSIVVVRSAAVREASRCSAGGKWPQTELLAQSRNMSGPFPS